MDEDKMCCCILRIDTTKSGDGKFASVYRLAGCIILSAATGCGFTRGGEWAAWLRLMFWKKRRLQPLKWKAWRCIWISYYPYWHKYADRCERNVADDGSNAQTTETLPQMQSAPRVDLVSSASLLTKEKRWKKVCVLSQHGDPVFLSTH